MPVSNGYSVGPHLPHRYHRSARSGPITIQGDEREVSIQTQDGQRLTAPDPDHLAEQQRSAYARR
ncbi:MAG: hypothetical protein R3F44_14745 [Candidatus Competibacteraceae bacterium]